MAGGVADDHLLRHTQSVEELLAEGEGNDLVATAVEHEHRHAGGVEPARGQHGARREPAERDGMVDGVAERGE